MAEPGGTRTRLLDAAAELMAGSGLEVPMAAIAEAAGVTRMTLYRHIGSREELLVQVLVRQSRRLTAEVAALLDEPGRAFGERLVGAMVLIVTAVRASPVLSLYVEEITPSQLGALDRVGTFLTPIYDFLRPRFEAPEVRAQLRAGPEETLNWTLRQTLLQLIVDGPASGSPEGLRAELEQFFIPSILTPAG